jgi:streptogramin lyase
MQKRIFSAVPSLLAAMASAALLTGCSTGFQPNPIQTGLAQIGNIQGTVHGGQAPLKNAQIYLYQAGTGGYRTSATSLICNSTIDTNACPSPGTYGPFLDGSGNYYVLTDASGNFSLGGTYMCTSGREVYMVAAGGDAGSGNNSAIVQMAGLGICPTGANATMAAQVPYLVINEVTTVAFAYSMGGFASSAYNVATPGTTESETAITNAQANETNIVNLQWGQAPTVANGNTSSISPQSKIYALADILAVCVNSTGAGSSQCQTLLADAVDISGNRATDEATAIFNLVHNPTAYNPTTKTSNVTALYKTITTNEAFSPYISKAPTDWTLSVVYPGAVGTPFNIAFDANGNAWIGDEDKGVVEIGPQGAVSTYNPGFGEIKGVAVSPNGTIWAADFGGNTIDILNTSGVVTTTMANTNGLDGPSAIAFDAAGNAWVSNDTGNTISKFDSSGGNVAPGKAHTMTGISGPAWIAVDGNDNAFVPSYNSTDLGVLAAGNGNTKGNAYAIAAAYALTIDSGNNIWMASNTATPEVYEVTASARGTYSATASYSNKGNMDVPYMITMDGGGALWISNEDSAVLSGFDTTTGTFLASTGFTTGSTGNCLAATPDLSGNLWTANSDGTVSQILGLGTPTAAPMIPGNFEKTP